MTCNSFLSDIILSSMATLIRSKNATSTQTSSILYAKIPTPFPRDQLDQDSISSSRQDDKFEVAESPFEGVVGIVEHDNPFENEVMLSTSVESSVEAPNTLTLVTK